MQPKRQAARLVFLILCTGLVGVVLTASVSVATDSEAGSARGGGTVVPVPQEPAPDEPLAFINPGTGELVACPDGEPLTQSTREASSADGRAAIDVEDVDELVVMPTCEDGSVPNEYLEMLSTDN